MTNEEERKRKKAEYNREYREANKDKIAERKRKYAEANKDKIAERKRKYAEANKDKIAEYQRKYAEANKDKIAERKRKYAEANKDKIAERMREYAEANKDKAREYREANKDKIAERMRERYHNDPQYRAMCEIRCMTRRVEKGGKLSLEIYGVPTREMVLKIKRGRLRIYNKHFKGVKKHLDHIRPLAEVMHSVEEMHARSHFTNLLYIPAEANLSKNATPFWEWFATLTDKKLIKCISEQDAYNKKIQRQLNADS
jgi:hypothetical protein